MASIINLSTQSPFVWYKFRRSPYHVLLKRVHREFTRCQWKLILAPDVNDLDHVTLFVKQKKVNSSDNILFSLLASLFAHQICQSLYIIAPGGCNRNNLHRLIFWERKFPLFWLTESTNFRISLSLSSLAYNAQECDHVSLTNPFGSSLLEAWAWNSRYSSCNCRGFIFHSHWKGLQKWSFRSSKQNDLWVKVSNLTHQIPSPILVKA